MNIRITGTEEELKCMKDFLLQNTVHQMMSIDLAEKIDEHLFSQEIEYVVDPVCINTKDISSSNNVM